MSTSKHELRASLRTARRDHVARLDSAVRSLLFLRPPKGLLDLIAPDDVVGLYAASAEEAPTGGYARFFAEQGHVVALPRFEDRDSSMEFARFSDPFGNSDLRTGPFGVAQPSRDAERVDPDVVFVPVIGFAADGGRLGQGGGHYDRFLASRPRVTAIGLAWDIQLVENLPLEDHDVRLHAVVTPTRLFGPF